MASNSATVDDEDGDSSDWIELHNPAAAPIGLQNYFLTDDPLALTKWPLPNVSLAAGEYLLVFASGKDRRGPAGTLHTNFRLAGGGEYLALTYWDGGAATPVHAFAPAFPPQTTDVSYGLTLAGVERYFNRPTPGAANDEAAAESPVFSRAGGTFTGSFPLTLSANAPGAVIRYTLDGTAPTTSSTPYSIPISITVARQVRAQVYEAGMTPGPVVSHSYVRLANDVQNFSSNIPIIVVDNFGAGDFVPDSLKSSYMAIFEPDGSGRCALTNAPNLDTRAGVKIRGRSTLNRPKKAYAVETWDEADEDKSISPFGMPRESDWILYAPYNFDRALIRNAFIYTISNQAGRYASRVRFCEVFVNTDGTDLAYADYVGVYVFMEKIKRDEDRVDVEALSPSYNTEPAITGGYILKNDSLDPGDTGFRTSRSHPGPSDGTFTHYCFVYPKEEELSPQQRSWVINHFEEFEDALYGPNFRDPLIGYAKFFDVGSFIDHHWLNELTKNPDGLRLSAYMFKKRDGKLQAGPIWDFDRTMGCADDGRSWNTDEWYAYTDYDWFGQMNQDIDYMQKRIDRWQEFRRGAFGTANLHALIDSMAVELSEAQARNFTRWPAVLPRFGSWQGEVDHLKDWLARRGVWIDSQYLAPPVFSHQGGAVPAGFQLSMTPPHGLAVMYYTTNGADPRLPGGAIDFANATPYTGSVSLTQNCEVQARTVYSGIWSGITRATFVVEDLTGKLAVTELMYHPPDAPVGDPDSEFVEIHNASAQSVNLSLVRLAGEIDFTFPELALPAGGYAVVVKDQAAFIARYGGGVPLVAGPYTGSLGDAGGELRLEDPIGRPLCEFTYNDGWGWTPAADGAGHSLVPRTAALDRDTSGSLFDYGGNWRASSFSGGSPGGADPAPPAGLALNEFVAHTDLDDPAYPAHDSNDWIEITNVGAAPIATSGYYLSDDIDDLKKWAVSNPASIAPGDYVTYDEISDFHNPITSGFGLDKAGEWIFLSYLPGTAEDRVVDCVRFAAQENGAALGRDPDGAGYWLPMQPTRGASNAAPKQRLAFSEFMYHPGDGSTASEYIEIFNPSLSLAVNLWNAEGPWRLDGAVGYTFPPNTSLAAGATLLVLPFDPGAAAALDDFKTSYSLTALDVQLFGPYERNLSNHGERLTLERPQAPDALGQPRTWVVVDEVIYFDDFPFPPEADGAGASLTRVTPADSGNDPANWIAAPPSPGHAEAPPVVDDGPCATRNWTLY